MNSKSSTSSRKFRKRKAPWLAVVLVVLAANGFTAAPLYAHGGGGGGGGHGGGMGGMGGMGGGHMGGSFSGGSHMGGGYVGSGHVGGGVGATHFGVGAPSVGHIGGGPIGGAVHSTISPPYGAHWSYTPAYHSGPIYGGAHYVPSWHYGSTYGLYHGGYGGYSHWSYSWHPYYHHVYPVYYGHGYFGSYWPSYYYPAYYSVTYYGAPAYGYVTASSTNSYDNYARTYELPGARKDTPNQPDSRFAPRVEIQTKESPEALPTEPETN